MIIHRKLFFNSLIRTLLEGYLKFCIGTFISLSLFRETLQDDLVNAILSVLMAVILVTMPLAVCLFL
jgi:hypothetical protein